MILSIATPTVNGLSFEEFVMTSGQKYEFQCPTKLNSATVAIAGFDMGTMIFDMIPLRQPQESRPHCQWVYAGRPDTFYVFLFQDRKDAPSRRVASNVQLERL